MRGGSMEAYFSPNTILLRPHGQTSDRSSLKISLRGALTNAPAGEKILAGKVNYLKGSDPSKWRRGISLFAALRYQEVYPGIDLVFYGNERELEHDFVIAPGGDPRRIRLKLDGAQRIQLSRQGDLQVRLANGDVLRFTKPIAYQGEGDSRQPIDVRFVKRGSQISFAVGDYDHTQPLTIDPVMSFATYLGGSSSDQILDITTDAAGFIYVTGATASLDFPTQSPIQATCKSCTVHSTFTDAFISKFDPDGTTLMYSTYLGSDRQDTGKSISVDSQGRAIVVGITLGTDFPNVNFPSTTFFNHDGIFVVSLSSDGTSLNFSGSFWPVDSVDVYGAVDNVDNVYVTGYAQTFNTPFPSTPGTLPYTFPGNYFADSGIPFLFVLKMSPNGSIVYSSVVMGHLTKVPLDSFINEFRPRGIAVTKSGSVVIAGNAGRGFPVTPGAYSGTYTPPLANGFVLRLNPAASKLDFATYLPGTSEVWSMALTQAEDGIYVAGGTTLPGLPVSQGALQETRECECSVGYVLKLDANGTRIKAATYLQPASYSTPSSGTRLWDMAVGNDDTVEVVGLADSSYYPIKNPIQAKVQPVFGPWRSFVSRLNSDLKELEFSTFLPGNAEAKALAVSPAGKILVAGAASDPSLPVASNAFQKVLGGGGDGFVLGIDPAITAPSLCLDRVEMALGPQITSPFITPVRVTNCGNADLHVTSIESSTPVITTTHDCGNVSAGAFCTIQVSYTAGNTGIVEGTITVHSNAPGANRIHGTAGIAPASLVYPFEVILGNVLVGTTSVPKTIRFQNSMLIAAQLFGFGVSSGFNQTNDCPQLMAPESFCTFSITWSPTTAGDATGFLVISSSGGSGTQVITLKGTAISSLPTPAITTAAAVQKSGNGRLTVKGQNFSPSSVVRWGGANRPTTFISGEELQAQLTPADVASMGETQVSVVSPAPGGGTSNAVMCAVYAELPLQVQVMVYDRISHLIYASVTEGSPTYSGKVVAVDPALMAVTQVFDLGVPPNQLAVSDDGSFLYVGLDSSHSIAQLGLSTGTVNFTVPLGSGNTARSIRALPGQPHAYVVSIGKYDFAPGNVGLKVFDDSVARPNEVAASDIAADEVIFAGNTPMLIATNAVPWSPKSYRFTVDAQGISLATQTTLLGGNDLAADDTSIYLANGSIADPSTLTAKPSFVMPADAFPTTLGVEFGTAVFAMSGKLLAFDSDTRAYKGALDLPAMGVSQLRRWGTNGLAFRSGGLVLLRTNLIDVSKIPGPNASISQAQVSFAPVILGWQSPSAAIQITNIGNQTLVVNSVTATGDFHASHSCTTIAAGASCPIEVNFLPTALGMRSGTLSVSSNGIGGNSIVALEAVGFDISLSLTRPRRPARNASSATMAQREFSLLLSGMDEAASFSCDGGRGVDCEVRPGPPSRGPQGTVLTGLISARTIQRAARLKTPSSVGVVKLNLKIRNATYSFPVSLME